MTQKQELIKERNKLAKQIFMKNDRLTESVAQSSVEMANTMMEQLYGKGWVDETGEQPSQQPTPSGDAVITIHKDAEGTPDGVRIQGLGEDFLLTLHDAEDGKNKSYDEWMDWLKEHGKTTLTRKQAYLVGLYIDEVNDKLEEAGGDALAADWYTTTDLYIPKSQRSCADYYAKYSWCYGGTNGCLSSDIRGNGDFRCRPALACTLE